MNKTKISIVKVGGFKHDINWNKIINFKSSLFLINDISNLKNLPKLNFQDGYLDAKIDRNQNRSILKVNPQTDLTVGITEVRFTDGFYLHRLSANKAMISLDTLCDFLEDKDISLENFIINQLYTLVAIWNRFGNLVSMDIKFVAHQDTRRCLFDLTGDIRDVVYNTEKPILCSQCKTFLSSGILPDNYIVLLEKDLLRIDKPYYLKLESAIKSRPWLSLSLAVVSTIALNILSNFGSAYLFSGTQSELKPRESKVRAEGMPAAKVEPRTNFRNDSLNLKHED